MFVELSMIMKGGFTRVKSSVSALCMAIRQ